VTNKYKKNFDIDFAIFITQTILITLYPYFSFHKILSPTISLFIVSATLLLNIRNKQMNTFVIRWILLFSLVISFSFINASLSALQSDKIILFFSQIAYFYSAATLLQSKENQTQYIAMILALVITTSLYGIWQYFTGFAQLETFIHTKIDINNSLLLEILNHQLSIKNVNSIFTNKNIFASFLLISIPIFFYSFKNLKENLLLLLLLTIPLIALFLATSKAGYLLFIAAIYFIFIIKKPSQQLFTVILLFCLVLITTQLKPDYFKYLEGSIQSRIYYFKSSLEIIKDNFLFGAGLNSFKDEYILHMKSYYEVTKHAHNYLLEIATECGIAQGIIIFFLFSKIIFFTKKNVSQLEDKLIALKNKVNNTGTSKAILLISSTPVFIAILLFPPFTFFPVEYSSIISLLILLGCLALAQIIRKLLDKSNFSVENAVFIIAIILLLHSFISISFNKMIIGTLFFGFLGFLSTRHSQINKINKLAKIENRILQVILIIGIMTITIYILSNYFYLLAKTNIVNKQFAKAENHLQIATKISPFNFDNHLSYLKIKLMNSFNNGNKEKVIETCQEFKNLSKISPKNHLVWSELATILSQHSKLRYLSSYLENAIKNALKLAPVHSKVILLKAINQEQNFEHKKALETYQELLKINTYQRFNYILSLNDSQLNYVKSRIILLKKKIGKSVIQ